MSQSTSEGLEVATITVSLRLTSDGDEQVWVAADPDGLSLVTVLGMLEFAKDSVIRDRMDDNEDDG